MDIDVSKENIQPLRGGRNLVQLGAALQAQSDADAQKQLQQQKEEHEAAIRHYQGPDPLDPWFNYIQWVEQSYPKHGHEGNIDKLIKDCLQLFEKDERYFQDRRLVKLWIKYVDCLSNPLEIYQRLYNTGIGIECSEFYRAWACYCEESGDYKKANQVYMLGLQAKAQPLDELEQAHMNFQLFFAQRMLHDDSPTKRKAASALAETRMALTSLRSFKRRNIANVPVHRIGDNIKSSVPGVVRQQASNYDNRMPNSNLMVNVFEDAPSTSHGIPVVENPGSASLVQACSNVENEKEIGIWTNPKTKMVHSNVVPHQPLPFTPYEDEDDVLRLPQNHMAYCPDDLSWPVPICITDTTDPTKIPCYNKSEVYVSDKEYSLEEIRSRKYKLVKKQKTELPLEIKNHPSHKNINETLVQCSALETLANYALDSEHDHLGQLMPLTIPTLQNITKVTNIHSPGEPKVLVNLDSKEFSELSVRENNENQKLTHSMAEKDRSIGKYPTADNFPAENGGTNYGKNNLMEEFNRSLMGNLLGDSVTVNTKEARWELRNLFNDNEPSMVQPVVQQIEVPNFDIHEDRSITMALNTKRKQEIADVRALPDDKENANKFPVPVPVVSQNVNRTAYYEEPSCTQVFNFNIKNASTPNMSQFKKPSSSVDLSTKFPNVPKFNMDGSVSENVEVGVVKKDDNSRQISDQHATVDHQGGGLSVIMEATREYNSKSGSSSSGQSTRTNFTGYTTNFDSMYNNHNDPSQQPTTSKRSSISAQTRLSSGQFTRVYPHKREQPELPPTAVPYHSHDHQYQKPMNANYNGYSPQRTLPPHYPQNYSYQMGYSNNQMMHPQQGYGSPNPNPYHRLGKIISTPVPTDKPNMYPSQQQTPVPPIQSPVAPIQSPAPPVQSPVASIQSPVTPVQAIVPPAQTIVPAVQSPPHQPQYHTTQSYQPEIHSEDSRDSVSKESRISSVYSRQSDFQSDGGGMDVDSENSMECGAFKSTHSISLIETSDIPRPADIEFPKVIDPFNKKIISSLLEYVKFPNKTHADGYIEVRSVPKLQPATVITVGNNKFSIEKQLGKGNYGAVFLCLDINSNKSVAVKYQKPSRPWEFYICQEIKARIKDPFMLPGYMDINTAFIGENASLFVSEYSKYGSLLDVANKVRVATSKCINEFIVILLTSEMLSIIHYLHKAQIIHADIKPDNFLLMKIPTQEWRTPSLQLIDFGCAIDMSLFPEGTTFRELIATEGFTCTEMRERKPWTYQTDLYCLAGTIHVILMGSYMKVVNRLGQWNIDKKLPRYMKVSLWDKIFTTLLNVSDCNSLPDIMDLKSEVDSTLNEIDNMSSQQLRNFANVLKSR
ncbi:hypothetical protein ACJJTC_008273 [Scirpophaga incertulas]